MRLIDYGDDINDEKKILIIGENFSFYWGSRIMSQMVCSDNPLPANTQDSYKSYLQYIYNKHYVVCKGMSPNQNGCYFDVQWIDLLLSNDGENVTHIISVILRKE